MSKRHEKLAKQQLALAEEIFTHKSQIANIELQLGRVDEAEADREWLARAKYALSMKRAELGKLEQMLDALELASVVLNEEEDESLNAEFVAAAKRRLDPEVVDDLFTEAREIIEDRMYGVVEHVQPQLSTVNGNV